MKKRPYPKWVLADCPKSRCPDCHGTVTLLSKNDAMPAFYICWTCKAVAEVGSGPVRKETE